MPLNSLSVQQVSICVLFAIFASVITVYFAVKMVMTSSVGKAIAECVSVLPAYLCLSLTIQTSRVMRGKTSYDEFMVPLMKCPLWVLAAVGIASVLVSALLYYFLSRHHVNEKPGPLSVIDGFNTISAGICCFDGKGLVRLKNSLIDEICVAVTGKALKNGKEFVQCIADGNISPDCTAIDVGSNPCIRLSDGRVFSFVIESYETRNQGTITEINAFNITENYNLSTELEQKRDNLIQVNNRLKELGNSIQEEIIGKETLDAKVRIHNSLGQLLISTKHDVTRDVVTDSDDLMTEWQKQALFLGSDSEDVQTDKYETLFKAAADMDLDIEVKGTLPYTGEEMEITANAIHQCITNTLRHSDGNRLTITAEGNAVSIADNGTSAAEPVTEGVGLSSLRTIVQNSGGTMDVSANGSFVLTIRFA